MKRGVSFGFVLAAIVVAVMAGAVCWSQWLQTISLRTEVEAARAEIAELGRLRADNARLRARQIPAAQLVALRADHVALPQLRAQVEALSKPTAP